MPQVNVSINGRELYWSPAMRARKTILRELGRITSIKRAQELVAIDRPSQRCPPPADGGSRHDRRVVRRRRRNCDRARRGDRRRSSAAASPSAAESLRKWRRTASPKSLDGAALAHRGIAAPRTLPRLVLGRVLPRASGMRYPGALMVLTGELSLTGIVVPDIWRPPALAGP